jgi:hypothetical protein
VNKDSNHEIMRGERMDNIAKARAEMNQLVARYVVAHPDQTYENVAQTLEVSRWRVLTVAAGLGISRKSGPKPKPQITIR